MKAKESGMSYETKTIIVILTLLFITPVGLVLMWVWMKWPLWLKILLTVLPFLFVFLIAGFVISIFALVFSNPQVQKEMKTQIQESIQVSQTPTQSQTNITNYTSTYGYSFAYPSPWTVQDVTEETRKNSGNAVSAENLVNTETNEKFKLVVTNWPIAKSRGYLNYGEGGFRAKASTTTEQIQGKEITKAVVTLWEEDLETGETVGTPSKRYVVLIPLANNTNTLRIEGTMEQKNTIDNLVSTLQFTQ
jgi:hypothetical protein